MYSDPGAVCGLQVAVHDGCQFRVQVVLIATLFSNDAFTFALSLCSHLSLLPYFLAAAYALKLVRSRETYDRDRPGDVGKDEVIANMTGTTPAGYPNRL